MTEKEFIIGVESTQRSLRRFLCALCCGDSRMADDLAQETFIKAFLAYERLSDDSKFKPWLFKIAHNVFLSSRSAAKPNVDYEYAVNIPSPHLTDGNLEYQGLYMALENIPPKERLSVVLFYLEGYSIKEISSITDTAENTVKQQLHRGRQHLKQLLENTSL